MKTKAVMVSSLLAALVVAPAFVQADALGIVNGGFETGSVTDSSFMPISGWSDSGASAGFWLANDNAYTDLDAASPQAGSLFLSGNRLVGEAGSEPSDCTLSQTVNLSAANLALVADGSAILNLDFYYHDEDPADEGTVTITFLDGSAGELGFISTGVLSPGNYSSEEWTFATLSGGIDSATEALRIDVSTHRISATCTNLQFDSFSGSVVPEPSTIALTGLFGVGAIFMRRRMKR